MITSTQSPLSAEPRLCPHCKATILKSATTCPACHRYLRFDPVKGGRLASPIHCPLRVRGTIGHPGSKESLEYAVVMQVQNDRGDVISRHVVGVGGLDPAKARTFILRVEVFGPQKSSCPRTHGIGAGHFRDKPPSLCFSKLGAR